tara:strand:- start:47976 stop:52526 length:4551 start_codon:yes stop_codon:yes gene_type:complete
MASKDFRTGQIETSKIIGTGSIAGTTAGIVIYSGSVATNRAGGTSDSAMYANVGSDVFLFVSGTVDKDNRGTIGARSNVSLFGGDVVVSGTLYAERMIIEVDQVADGDFFVTGSMFVEPDADSTTSVAFRNAAGTTIFNVDSTNKRIGIGDVTPDALLDIQGEVASGVPTLKVVHLDSDVTGIDIDASNTNSVAVDLFSSTLTSGMLLQINENSSDTTARSTVLIKQNHSSATGATAVKIQSDSDGAVPALHIDRNAAGTVAADGIKGIYIDLDQTGEITSATANVIGVDVEIETNSAADGIVNAFGQKITMTGDTDGTHSHTGLSINLGQADNNTHIEMLSSADTGDKCTIAVGSAGATTIETIDDDAAAANLTFNVDGKTKFNSDGFEIENPSDSGRAALQIDNNDIDQVALDIDSSTTTAQVIDIDCSNTTGDVVNINAPNLTTGGALTITDSSASSSSRATVLIEQSGTAATGATTLSIVHDANTTSTTSPAVKIDKNHTGTGAGISLGLHVDIDQTGEVSSATHTIYGILTEVETNAASDGIVNAIGQRIFMSGDTDGTHSHTGLQISLGDADNNTHIEMNSKADSGDKCTIAVGLAGETTIATTDDDGANAHLILDPDGDIYMRPTSALILTGDLLAEATVFDIKSTGAIKFTIDSDNDTTTYFTVVDSVGNEVFYVDEGQFGTRFNHSQNAASNFKVSGNTDHASIFVDAGEDAVALGWDGDAVPNWSELTDTGTDVKIVLSGTVGSRGGVTRGTTLVAGDFVTSGSTTLLDKLTVSGDIKPGADDTYDIGSAASAWKDLFLEGDITLTDTGTIATTAGNLQIKAQNGTSAVVVTGILKPGADDTYDLGTTSAAWKNIHLEGDIIMSDAGEILASAGDVTIKAVAGRTILTGSSGNDSVLVQSDIQIDGKSFITDDIQITANKKIFFDGASISNGPFIFGNTTAMTMDGDNRLFLDFDTDLLIRDAANTVIKVVDTGAATGTEAQLDANIVFSGSIGSKGTTTRGTTIFGGDVVISGTLHGGSPLTLGGDLLPSTDDTFDLGSASQAWQDLHLEGNVLMTDAGSVSAAAGDLTLASAAAQVIIGAETRVLIMSGGNASHPDPATYADTSFFVSGAIGSRASATKGTALFGGDLVLSGNLVKVDSIDGTVSFQAANVGIVLPANKVVEFGDPNDKIFGDGTNLHISSSADTFIVSLGDNVIDSGNGKTLFEKADTEYFRITRTAGGDIQFQPKETNKDLIFLEDGGNEIARLDSSNETFAMLAGKKITFDGTTSITEFISGDGANLSIGSSNKVLILSGGAAASPHPIGSDVNFFVSGAIGSKGKSTEGTAAFGGDIVVSGNLHVTDLHVAGNIKGGSLHIHNHRIAATTSEKFFSPFRPGENVANTDIDTTAVLLTMAPYSGSLEKINIAVRGGGSFVGTVGLYVNGILGAEMTGSSENNATTYGGHSDIRRATFDFAGTGPIAVSGSTKFNANDLISCFIKAGAARDCSVTTVFRLNDSSPSQGLLFP